MQDHDNNGQSNGNITITITISITWRFHKQLPLSNSFTRDEDDLANIFAFLLLQNIQNNIFIGKLLILLSRQNIQNFPWKSKDRHLKFSPLGLLVWETEQILQIPSLIQKKSTKKKLNRKVCKVFPKQILETINKMQPLQDLAKTTIEKSNWWVNTKYKTKMWEI